jgi:hypothetical protein
MATPTFRESEKVYPIIGVWRRPIYDYTILEQPIMYQVFRLDASHLWFVKINDFFFLYLCKVSEIFSFPAVSIPVWLVVGLGKRILKPSKSELRQGCLWQDRLRQTCKIFML